ncbi:GtrA family protein [Rhizobium oryzicola]|uniref:GtrA family protein n=1 Tax=Rhizobium oryzicola TaxID=1232668 RepID=A0ABT8T4D2_9HYPH|nr:GtrA family protein [Rhizobium oryzicola]MDO1585587.1 GtrA family protein [Rhizobium oryzicola]
MFGRESMRLPFTIGRQIAFFAAVGLLATAVHYAAALLLTRFLPLTLANPCGFAVALMVSYFGHARLTFSAVAGQGRHVRRFPKFILVALGGFIINQSIVFALSRTVLPNWLVLGIAIAVVPVATFIASKFWVFAVSQKDGETGDC